MEKVICSVCGKEHYIDENEIIEEKNYCPDCAIGFYLTIEQKSLEKTEELKSLAGQEDLPDTFERIRKNDNKFVFEPM